MEESSRVKNECGKKKKNLVVVWIEDLWWKVYKSLCYMYSTVGDISVCYGHLQTCRWLWLSVNPMNINISDSEAAGRD